MTEITSKRTYSKKFFNLGGGVYQLDAHVGHIHYEDKLGDGTFKPIDWTLVWDAVNSGWTFTTHSFRPFIPQYADGWLEFRDLYQQKDQRLRLKADASHVLGVLCPNGLAGVTDTNCVLYANAFGSGVDLIYGFRRSELIKLVRVRAGFYPTGDLILDWQIDVSALGNLAISRGTIKTARTNLQLTGVVTLPAGDQIFIGTEQDSAYEWFTYIRQFRVWDSNGGIQKREVFGLQIAKTGPRIYLRKVVPLSFFANATGDVLTDTTTSYYAGAGDGIADSWTQQTWQDTRLAGADGVNYTGSTGVVIAEWNVGEYFRLTRFFVPIDTSGITDGATIDAASLFIKPWLFGGTQSYGLVQTTQADPTVIAITDMNAMTIDSPAEGVTRWANADMTGGAYKELVFNATGKGWVSTTGYTKLAIRQTQFDIDAAEPVDAGRYCYFYTSEETGTGSDPYLSVTYTDPVTGGAKGCMMRGFIGK